MSEVLVVDRVAVAVAAARAPDRASDPVAVTLAAAQGLVDELLAMNLAASTDADLLASYRELERLSRRLAAVEHRFLALVESRSIPFAHGAASTRVFLRRWLRLHPGEAAARVSAAQAAGPQRSLTGEPVEPIYPAVAAAQAAGTISAPHAAVIVHAVDTLPDAVQVTHGAQVEADLVGYAAEFDPHHLAVLAHRVHPSLDPDGLLKDSADRARCRDLSVRARPDGSSTLSGELTAECTERLLGVFDALAAPVPAPKGAPQLTDRRSAGQPRHDALLDALTLLQRADALPSSAGVATTVIVTMDADTYRTGRGTATTSHGALVPARDALGWGGGDVRLLAVALDSMRAVTASSNTARLFSENQRLAVLARDRGCTFPDCDTPPAWTQVHHIDPWISSKRTSIDNAAMLCGFHHRHFEGWGWTCQIIHSRPAFIPPPHVDPDQHPQRNRLHETPARR